MINIVVRWFFWFGKHSTMFLFPKILGKKKKDKLSGLSEHLKKKIHQLDWSSVKILAKENKYWKRRSKEVYLITKHKHKEPLLDKKNECAIISSIWKKIL